MTSYYIAICDGGDAFHTSQCKTPEEHVATILDVVRHYDPTEVFLFNGTSMTDVTAEIAKRWVNSHKDVPSCIIETDFPLMVRAHAPDLVEAVMAERREEDRHRRELRRDYYAGLR